ncbi:helix-turn-helix domain-containing protein [Pseudorhodobacter turbinis]|uniref:Helix-turn-helix domain-containing protein n=1 Tax=Pseudorhodobacter turbinis TaxID=2500533 RepID=A0A4P8EDR7_9RHOB|nr:helix-turn-helix domain-containing protein [Pseudorhodobacter turbinis]QCO54515.1 helix-turn-helix domain-containing protein [Pseudorhodobacter turbinis]
MMQQLQQLSDTEGHAASVLGRQVIEVLALALDDTATEEACTRTAVRAGHLRRAEHIIRQNLANQNLSPDFVADACGISKRYLHELFSDTNKTVSQFIREKRLLAARDAITTNHSLAMAEIAYCFGFSDQAQFSRLFKAQFAATPSEWRRNAPHPERSGPHDTIRGPMKIRRTPVCSDYS